MAYQHSSSHKHKHLQHSVPHSPSPLVRMCIPVLDARLYPFVSLLAYWFLGVKRGLRDGRDIRQLQRAPSTRFSVPALSQVHFSADCFPHEQVAWEAQTQAAPERPQQVEGMVMVVVLNEVDVESQDIVWLRQVWLSSFRSSLELYGACGRRIIELSTWYERRGENQYMSQPLLSIR